MVSILFIGNFIFLNLFLTVLLDAFEKENEKLKQELEKKEEAEEIVVEEPKIDQEEPKINLQEFLKMHGDESPKGKRGAIKDFKDKLLIENASNLTFAASNEEMMNSFLTNLFEDFNNSKSLLIFSENDLIRAYCMKVASHSVFRKMSKLLIILQIILITVQSYQDQETLYTNYLNFFIFSFFAFEAVCKIIATGFLLDNEAYLRSYGNIINFGAVFGFYSQFLYFGQNPTFKVVFSIIQTFVPLRILETNKNLKKIVLSFWQSLEEIMNVVVALLLVWFIIKIIYFK